MTEHHRVLKRQLRQCTTSDGKLEIDGLLKRIDATYAQFDLDRRLSDHTNNVLVAEVDEYGRLQREALERLQREHVRLDLAMENMAHALAMFTPDGRLELCNSFYCKLIGGDLQPGMHMSEISKLVAVQLANPGPDLSLISRAITNGEAIEHVVHLKDGRVVNVTIQPNADGGWVSVYKDVTKQYLADEQIRFLARHDPLTELPNRVAFNEVMASEAERAKRGGQYAVIIIDIDNFKAINDSLGHAAGDAVLRGIARRLKSSVRSTDLVARLGGDEFAIVQMQGAQPVGAAILGERLIAFANEPIIAEGRQINVGLSVGIAVSSTDSTDAAELFRMADSALYQSKVAGRGRFRFFDHKVGLALQDRRSMEIDLTSACENGQFELHYQPMVAADTSRIVAFEALLRWNHPTKGRVAPDQFIPAAEELGLMPRIGKWVLETACRAASKLPADIAVSVNASASQFKLDCMSNSIREALANSRLAPHRLEIEITETVLLDATSETVREIEAIRGMGVRMALDDFGAGHSSLTYLSKFAFDKIKIDRSFVSMLETSASAFPIIKAITDLAHTLNISTTAEGVETERQHLELKRLRCSELQGYLISRPMPEADINPFLGRTAVAA